MQLTGYESRFVIERITCCQLTEEWTTKIAGVARIQYWLLLYTPMSFLINLVLRVRTMSSIFAQNWLGFA